MVRKLYCLCLFFFCLLNFTSEVRGQSSFIKKSTVSKVPEKGLVLVAGGGGAAVASDICKAWPCNNFGRNLSLGVLYKLSPYVSLGANLDNSKFGAEEKNPLKPLNISFQTEVIAITGTVVVNLIDSYVGASGYRSLRKRFVVPYVKAGAGFIYYTPTSFPGQGKLNESQTKFESAREYPALAAVIPAGVGLRFRFSDKISVAGELVYHLTLTDNLDNIGQNLGNPDNLGVDRYGVAAVKVMYTPAIKNLIFSGNKRSR